MTNPIVQVGSYPLEVTEGHIYLVPTLPATYDYVPWNIIGAIIAETKFNDVKLLDIGANVGDSLAHFRRHSERPVTCVEPSPEFFAILERNAHQFRDVTLVNKLLVPSDLKGRVAFQSGSQTGFSAEATHTEKAWEGECVTFHELGIPGSGRFIVKTDTDGFDAKIVSALLDSVQGIYESVPIVFFEGCSAPQIEGGDLEEWTQVIARLQSSGYRLLLLTNQGVPYIYAGTVHEVARSAIAALKTGYSVNRALCHYYDVIAVHHSIPSELVKLQEPLPPFVFSRE